MHYRNAVSRNLEFSGREIKREGKGVEISNVHTCSKMLRTGDETRPW